MKVIALRGPANSGKSETLNIVYQLLLLFGYNQVPGHYRELGDPVNKDCTDILERKGVRIGIAMMGDYEDHKEDCIEGDTIQELLTYLQNNGCKKALCACNSGLSKALAFIKKEEYEAEIVEKQKIKIASEMRISNEEEAEVIFKLI